MFGKYRDGYYTTEIDYQVTEPGKPNRVIESGEGPIGHRAWLKLELARIRKNPDRKAEIRTDKKGHISLWVNKWKLRRL
jgi:hypothetical protein